MNKLNLSFILVFAFTVTASISQAERARSSGEVQQVPVAAEKGSLEAALEKRYSALKFLDEKTLQTWHQSNCRMILGLEVGYEPEVGPVDRNHCIYSNVLTAIGSTVRSSGPILRERRGTVFYRPNDNAPLTICEFRVKPNKRISSALHEQIQNPPANTELEPLQDELSTLVDFACESQDPRS